MKFRVTHTPVGTMGTEAPYVVAEFETDMPTRSVEYVVAKEWKAFQATQPDSDSGFQRWLLDRQDDYSPLRHDCFDIHV